jgi:hypothetical protein
MLSKAVSLLAEKKGFFANEIGSTLGVSAEFLTAVLGFVAPKRPPNPISGFKVGPKLTVVT